MNLWQKLSLGSIFLVSDKENTYNKAKKILASFSYYNSHMCIAGFEQWPLADQYAHGLENQKRH